MTSKDAFNTDFGFGEGILVIVILLFIKQAETIVRRIFGFDNATSLGSAMASGALLMSSIRTAQGAISKSKGGKGKDSDESKSSSKPSTKTSNNADRNMKNSSTSTTSTSKQGTATRGATGNSASTKSRKVGNAMTNFASTVAKLNVKAAGLLGAKVTGAAIGMFAGDDPISGAMTGANFGTALGAKAGELGGRAGRWVSNKANPIIEQRRQRNNMMEEIKIAREKMNKEYQNLKQAKGYNDTQMMVQTRVAMNTNNLSGIGNSQERAYAQSVQDYRNKLPVSNESSKEMVLETVKKIQNGEIRATTKATRTKNAGNKGSTSTRKRTSRSSNNKNRGNK